MIIVEDKTVKNTVFFPKNSYSSISDLYLLVLYDRGTNAKYEFECTDLHLVPIDYYSFDVDFTKMPCGEYEYSIIDSVSNTMSKGIIRIGALDSTKKSYNKENEYIMYDPDSNSQTNK